MLKRLVIGCLIAVLLVGGSAGVAVATGVWGAPASKPPCSEWSKRVFDSKTGKINPPAVDEDGNGIGFSLSAARGLLDERACAWVFRPKGDKKNVLWDKRYRLEATYDMFVTQSAVEQSRWHSLESLIHVANYDFDKVVGYDDQCEADGGEVWQSGLSGLQWCNFPSSDGEITGGFNFEEGDYVIRGPR